MAELVTSTTAEELQERLIRRISLIEPSALKYRDHRWTNEDGNREKTTSLQTRAFVLFLGASDDVEEGLTGNADVETEVLVALQVDYRKVQKQDVGTLVAMDRQDLTDCLCDSWHPVIPGMTFSEFAGEEFVGDEKLQRFLYTFTVQYMRSRTTR
ncbi:MAG: hypothetical protein ACRBN8_22435 [Nannocystales bacterium]